MPKVVTEIMHWAHTKVSTERYSGRMPSQPCQVCGWEHDTVAHHDDYAKPLDVRWLCGGCHQEWHRHNSALNRDAEVPASL